MAASVLEGHVTLSSNERFWHKQSSFSQKPDLPFLRTKSWAFNDQDSTGFGIRHLSQSSLGVRYERGLLCLPPFVQSMDTVSLLSSSTQLCSRRGPLIFVSRQSPGRPKSRNRGRRSVDWGKSRRAES